MDLLETISGYNVQYEKDEGTLFCSTENLN